MSKEVFVCDSRSGEILFITDDYDGPRNELEEDGNGELQIVDLPNPPELDEWWAQIYEWAGHKNVYCCEAIFQIRR